MIDALAERPHTRIRLDKNIQPLNLMLSAMHPDVEVLETEIILNYDAIALRPQVLSLVLTAGYDVIDIQQSRVTLAEIYSEAVQ